MEITFEDVLNEQRRMEEERAKYEPLKKVCVDMAYPARASSWDLSDGLEGKANHRAIYDPTGAKSLEIWANGVIGNWMPKGISWFSQQMEDRSIKDSPSVRKWLQETEEHLRFVLGRSDGQTNYYDAKAQSIRDVGGIGDSFMYIDEDADSGKQMFFCPHPREFWVRRDFWGRIVAIHHKFFRTLRQVRDEFGEQGLSDRQKVEVVKSPNTAVEIIYAIEKNTDYDPYSLGVKKMKWRYVYANVPGKKIITDSGRATLNPVPWSLNRPSHEVYGRSVVSQVIVEIITANFIGKDMLMASQQAVSPAMLITSAIKNRLSLAPGSRNFVSSNEMYGLKMGDLISRIIDTSGYPFGIDQHERWQKAVEDRFGVPLFMALNYQDTGTKTAYEVRQMQAERVSLMSPFLSSLGTTTDMELDRVYALELESGRAPEPPFEVFTVNNRRINIEYIGPLHQMLKEYYETNTLMTTIQSIQAVLSIYPDAAIVVEADELMRKILRSANTPEDLILSAEEVAEIRAIQVQQQEAMMQAELAQKAASTLPNLGKKIENDSVLSAMMSAA